MPSCKKPIPVFNYEGGKKGQGQKMDACCNLCTKVSCYDARNGKKLKATPHYGDKSGLHGGVKVTQGNKKKVIYH